jgi:hypothetical protein
MGALTVRSLEVLDLEEAPWSWADLPDHWQVAVRELCSYTSGGSIPGEDVVDCEDCGTQVPTPVGWRWVSDGWTPRDGHYVWPPAVGVLEHGKVHWLCQDCGSTPAPAPVRWTVR